MLKIKRLESRRVNIVTRQNSDVYKCPAIFLLFPSRLKFLNYKISAGFSKPILIKDVSYLINV